MTADALPALDWRVRPASCARSVTRAESISVSEVLIDSYLMDVAFSGNKCRIDWLNATFPQPDDLGLEGLARFLSGLIGVRVGLELDGGMFGFTERYRMHAVLDDPVEIGAIAKGGESQKGRWLLNLNGKGCGLVPAEGWARVEQLLRDLSAEISRVDLALDFLAGEYSVDDALTMYSEGAFISRGRNPDLDIQGGWYEGSKKGRTVYVGKFKNGKVLCVYEKGRQLGTDTDWTRYEVRIGNRDRVVPLGVLTSPDRYFVGAYPALRDLLQAAAQEIPTSREEAKSTISAGLFHLSRCYGKYLHQIVQAADCDITDLIEEVRITGIPKRLDPAYSRHIGWEGVKEELRLRRERKLK